MEVVEKDSIEPTIQDSGEVIYELIRGSDREDEANHSLAFVELAEGESTEPHFHEESEETYYVLQGEGEVTVDGEVFRLARDQACLIQPGEVHEITGLDGGLKFLAVSVPAWTLDDSYTV